MELDQLREKARSLPLLPGVYLMKDQRGDIIYVGKAKALKNRVSQYFQDSAGHSPKTQAMVRQIRDFDTILVASEFEALVLENAQIKRHMPRYNILLKDDKGYPYVRLDPSEDYPRFTMVNRRGEDGALYFGPFGGRNDTQAALDAIRGALKLPSCHRKFPRDIGRERPCLNFHMGRCDAYCRPGLSQAGHGEKIRQAIQVLEGKLPELYRELEAEMERASEALEFERAAQLRDRIRALQVLEKKQKVVTGRRTDTDAVGLVLEAAKSCFVVIRFADGELVSKESVLFDPPVEQSREEALSALLNQYYPNTEQLPREILLPFLPENGEALEQLLTQRAGRKVRLSVPRRGARLELLRMAGENARLEAERAVSAAERSRKTLEWLQRALDLPEEPRRMEAFDISNTGSADIVASMAVFRDGKPLKKDYRHFILRDMTGPDDYGAMRQVLERRFHRYLEEDEAFGPLPQLLLIDGGAEHAAVAASVLAELGIDLPVFGMVKDERHRTRGLIRPGGEEIGLSAQPAAFALIGRLQEETHRFAVEFHHKRHSKSSLRSALDGIPGLGPARQKALLKAFKSVKGIREASLEELEAAIPKPAARAVYQRLHPKEENPCE